MFFEERRVSVPNPPQWKQLCSGTLHLHRPHGQHKLSQCLKRQRCCWQDKNLTAQICQTPPAQALQVTWTTLQLLLLESECAHEAPKPKGCSSRLKPQKTKNKQTKTATTPTRERNPNRRNCLDCFHCWRAAQAGSMIRQCSAMPLVSEHSVILWAAS